jgi:hypothetical protein
MSVTYVVEQCRVANGTHSWAATIVASLLIGISASALFVVLLAAELTPLAQTLPGWTIVPLLVALTFGSGAHFALVLARERGEPTQRSRMLIIGACLPLAGFAGLFGAGALEPVGLAQSGGTLVWVFRLAFVGASAIVAFVCTLVASRAFGVRGGVVNALAVASIAGGTYLLFALALDPLPGFHVGGGDRAMPKVAALCNLAAGSVGGATALRLLGRAHRAVNREALAIRMPDIARGSTGAEQ